MFALAFVAVVAAGVLGTVVVARIYVRALDDDFDYGIDADRAIGPAKVDDRGPR